jgi:ParB-like chromosome segregation protein Spo0J
MNKIIKTELVEWKRLKLFQPKELKTISKLQLNKLKESLKKNGFKAPFYVWQENEDNLWCLDGHTRIPILKLLEEEGHNVPSELPANFVDCKNKKEAKKAILIYNSRYADINKNEMFDFVSDLDLKELDLEIDIPKFNFLKEKDIDYSDRSFDLFQIVINCKSEKEQEKIYEKLKKEGYECQPLIL